MELAEEYAMNNHGFMKDNFKMARQMDMAERLEHLIKNIMGYNFTKDCMKMEWQTELESQLINQNK